MTYTSAPPRLEHKTLPLVRAKVSGTGPGTLQGYGSVFNNVDLQGDVILPGAFAATLDRFEREGFIAWHHDWAKPVATIRAAREDATGLFLEADFHSDPASQQARTIATERLARGKAMGLSIGFEVNPGGATASATGRTLTSLTLYEVSLVTVPANPLAGATAAKTAGGLRQRGGGDPTLLAIRAQWEAQDAADRADVAAIRAELLATEARGRAAAARACAAVAAVRTDLERQGRRA